MVVSDAADRPAELIDDAAHLLVKPTQPHWSEVHVPEPVIDFFEANLEFGEQVTHVHPALVPTHAAIAADQPALVMPGIEQRLEPRAVGPRRRRVAARRRRIAERFVRALEVVPLAEAIEAALLRRQVRLGWPGRRGLQRFVHPLVPAIL